MSAGGGGASVAAARRLSAAAVAASRSRRLDRRPRDLRRERLESPRGMSDRPAAASAASAAQRVGLGLQVRDSASSSSRRISRRTSGSGGASARRPPRSASRSRGYSPLIHDRRRLRCGLTGVLARYDGGRVDRGQAGDATGPATSPAVSVAPHDGQVTDVPVQRSRSTTDRRRARPARSAGVRASAMSRHATATVDPAR